MSGLEVLAVVAAVAAVVSAFNDGNRIVAKIKQKRRERNALPPTKYLEESLQSGPPAIESERDNGMRVFGQVFGQGDAIAIDSLQKIIIELQGTLLIHLYHAQEDDMFVDFSPVVKASDLGRVKAVSSLCDLYMRLETAAPIRPAITSGPQIANSRNMPEIEGLGIYGSPLHFTTPNQLPARVLKSDGRQDAPMTQNPSDSGGRNGTSAMAGVSSYSPPNSMTSRPSNLDPVMLTPDVGSPVRTMPESPATPKDDSKKRKPSILERFKRGSSKDQQTQPAIEVIAEHSSRGSYSSSSHSWDHSEGSHTVLKSNDKSSAMERKPSDSDDALLFELNQNVWGDSHTIKDTNNVTSNQPNEQKITHHPKSNLEVYESAPELYDSTSPSPAPPHLNHATSSPLPGHILPSSENNYGGFCKSAWKLQVGERDGIKVRKEMGIATSVIHVWGCVNKKCAFQGTVFGDMKHPIFDPRVHQSSTGIRFRWSFLVKSHVAQSKVMHGMYNYKCILCCSSNEFTPVFGGIDTLLKHLEIHRDKPVQEVLLHNAGCVMDRFAPDEEHFDLNIVPTTHGEDLG